MLKNLSNDFNLRGYSFEYIARILLRREKKNNFIFMMVRFDGLDEIIKKYRMKTTIYPKEKLNFIRNSWKSCDLIEFVLEDKVERVIKEIRLYDAKTKFHLVQRDYFETCEKNHHFMSTAEEVFNISANIISIILFEEWRFSFNILPYAKQRIRIYNSVHKKRVAFKNPHPK